jgi:GT2 family glycosyltransferase
LIPSDPDAWFRLGEQAWNGERWDAAEASLWQCLALEPHHGAALHLLGRLRHRQQRVAEAIRLQEASVRSHPSLGWNSFALAELLEAQGDWVAAAAAMASAARALPQEPWIVPRQRRLEGLGALGGERLQDGLGPTTYRYWCRALEAPLPQAGPESPPPGWHLQLAPGARLRPGALATVAAELARLMAADAPLPDGIYADEDRITDSGERLDPWFKPAWQPEAFWSTPWLDAFSLWREDWLQRVGLPPPPPPHQDGFGWLLQALEQAPQLLALPRILVHRHRAAPLPDPQRGAELLHRHLSRLGETVAAVRPMALPSASGFRLTWALPSTPVRVSVIVPTRDRPDLLAACLDGLQRSSDRRLELELWVVDNGSRLQASADLQRHWLEKPGLRASWLPADGPFNWSLLNNKAAQQASGDLLLFLNNDVRPQTPEGPWLSALAAQALRPAVGTAGTLLLTPEGRLQHAGILPGMGAEGCAHPYRGLLPDHGVHRGRSSFLTAWPALTGACLMVRRQMFLALGGFDPAFPVEGNDVEFCLRLGALGLRHVLTPEAVLIHAEGSTRGHRGDEPSVRREGLQRLRQRWPHAMALPGGPWPAACSGLHTDGRPRELAEQGWD